MTARGAASHGYLGNEEAPFHGAKLLLMESRRLLTCLRDDFAHIPFPAHWDLPGGGREGAERPVDCALRELFEEFGLRLASERLSAHVFRSHQRPDMVSWLFAGRLSMRPNPRTSCVNPFTSHIYVDRVKVISNPATVCQGSGHKR